MAYLTLKQLKQRSTEFRLCPARGTDIWFVYRFLTTKRDPKTGVVDLKPLYSDPPRGPFKKSKQKHYGMNVHQVFNKMKVLEKYYGFEIYKLNPGKTDGLFVVLKKSNKQLSRAKLDERAGGDPERLSYAQIWRNTKLELEKESNGDE